MALMIRAYIDVCQVPEGTGGVTVMPAGGMSNEPGFGAILAPGPMATMQTKRYQIAEPVTSVNAATLTTGNLTTAATQLGTDLGTLLTGDLAVFQGWQTGGP